MSIYPKTNEQRKKNEHYYPIGRLKNNIEVHFLHYESKEEAQEKWYRRLQRTDLSHESLFIQFSERDLCTYELLEKFELLSFGNKICFTTQAYPHLSSSIEIDQYVGRAEVDDGLKLFRACHRYFDVVQWLNSGDGKPDFIGTTIGNLLT